MLISSHYRGMSLNVLTSLAGPQMSPRGEAVLLLVWGLGAGLLGWFVVLRRTGVAEGMAGWGDQAQQDYYDAYGRGGPPSARQRKTRRFVTRCVGWAFAFLGPAFVITGVALLIRQ
ncbi:hypothetical protein ACFYUJ_28670 [Streptomyces sp. NPDC004520]|uniref:hypothetical protein n=1 Tax=Streptomyces sp. NPDC004520 TaxID=3364702 RepID=UPI0036C8D5A3